jgi:hypothetical protein
MNFLLEGQHAAAYLAGEVISEPPAAYNASSYRARPSVEAKDVYAWTSNQLPEGSVPYTPIVVGE